MPGKGGAAGAGGQQDMDVGAIGGGKKGKGGKGKGGKGKGKGKGGSLECKSHTPSGDSICFRYNAGGCKDPKCRFAHKCGKCFGDHPLGEYRA